jgi:hypothetical protein
MLQSKLGLADCQVRADSDLGFTRTDHVGRKDCRQSAIDTFFYHQ